jgi:hypothetical protein
VKRALAWFAGLVGIAALGRWLAHRSASTPAAEPEPAPAAAGDDPAEELRQRLAASRTPEQAAPVAAAQAEGETLEERRARIHAKAQEAIDAMREPGA